MIELIDLCKNYGGVKAVDHINLHVPRGELFCFLGPNGAGKTTTIKIMTGLVRADSGSASVAGFDIAKDALAAKQRMGYIPDMPYLYDRLTCTEFMRFCGDLYGVPAPRIMEETVRLLELFSLQEQAAALVRDLSHGMRQRLIYAATLLHEPEVLFIDEPLIGLDPYTIRLIKDLLRQKVRDGMTVFLTTHILALAEDIADRIAIVDNGSIIAMGSLAELKALHPEQNKLEDVFLHLTGHPENPEQKS